MPSNAPILLPGPQQNGGSISTLAAPETAVYNAVAPVATASGALIAAQCDVNGNRLVTIANTLPATSGGTSAASGAFTSATVAQVKATPGQVYAYFLDNTENAATTFFQFFNAIPGNVNLGTTPPVFSLAVPAGGSANLAIAQGSVFSTAISIAQTTTRAGNTAPSSNCTYTVWFA